jgi:hypothetical protein
MRNRWNRTNIMTCCLWWLAKRAQALSQEYAQVKDLQLTVQTLSAEVERRQTEYKANKNRYDLDKAALSKRPALASSATEPPKKKSRHDTLFQSSSSSASSTSLSSTASSSSSPAAAEADRWALLFARMDKTDARAAETAKAVAELQKTRGSNTLIERMKSKTDTKALAVSLAHFQQAACAALACPTDPSKLSTYEPDLGKVRKNKIKGELKAKKHSKGKKNSKNKTKSKGQRKKKKNKKQQRQQKARQTTRESESESDNKSDSKSESSDDDESDSGKLAAAVEATGEQNERARKEIAQRERSEAEEKEAELRAALCASLIGLSRRILDAPSAINKDVLTNGRDIMKMFEEGWSRGTIVKFKPKTKRSNSDIHWHDEHLKAIRPALLHESEYFVGRNLAVAQAGAWFFVE